MPTYVYIDPQTVEFGALYKDLNDLMLKHFHPSVDIAPGLTEIPDHFKGQIGDNQPSAIEADEAEPWYGGDAVEEQDSSVVTAEPPIVYANRGNARMEERRQAQQQNGS